MIWDYSKDGTTHRLHLPLIKANEHRGHGVTRPPLYRVGRDRVGLLCPYPKLLFARMHRSPRQIPKPLLQIPLVSPRWFHDLLNSLFKVLFNFPLRYLFAIGLVVIFSLRWNLPPALRCIFKQRDSKERSFWGQIKAYGPITLCGEPFQMSIKHILAVLRPQLTEPKRGIGRIPVLRGRDDPTRWASPCSVALTGGIAVAFFSSA